MQEAMSYDLSIDLPAGQELASGGQVTTRQLLVRKLTDIVVLPLGKISTNERNFAADILIRTLQNVDTPMKLEVAERLSTIADMPRHLLRYLLLADYDIAQHVLGMQTEIDETLLIEAADISREHRGALIRRDDLTPAVAEVLVRHSEVDVLKGVLNKDQISLSEHAMEVLVHRSRTEESLRGPLLRRPELRGDQAFIMYWWLNTEHRKQLFKRFMTDRSVIQEAMHELFVTTFTSDNPDMLVKASLKLVDRRHRPRGRDGETVTMEVVQKTLTAARCQPTQEFAHAVGLLVGVSQEIAEMVLFDVSGESFAIICKSVGLSRSAFAQIIKDNSYADPGSSAILSEEKAEELIGVFDSISRDFSRTILRYWDWKSDVFIPDPTDEDGTLGPGNYSGAL